MSHVSTTRRRALSTIAGVGALGVAGCLGQEADDVELTVMTADEATTGFQMAAAMASVINEEEDDITIDNRPADGAQQGVFEMDAGNTDIAFTFTGMANDIHLGEEVFVEQEFGKELRGLFHIYSVQSGLAAPLESDIETPYDLPGHRVAPNPPGSAIREPMLRMIGHAIDLDELETVGLSFGEESSALAENRVDVISDLRVNGAIAPGYVEEQYSVHDDLWLLHWPDDLAAEIADDPFLDANYFPAEAIDGPEYGDRTEEFWLDTIYNFYTSTDVDEDSVYRLMEAFWEHREAMSDVHPLTANWEDAEYLTTGLDIEVPVHEGAASFYDDEGISY